MLWSMSRLAYVLAFVLLGGCGGADYSKAAATPSGGGGADMPAAAPEAPPREMREEVMATESAPSSRGDAILSDKKAAVPPAAPPPPPPPAQRALIAQPNPAAKPGPAKGPAAGQASATSASDIAAARGPMLIYTANLTMAVFEVARSLADVEELSRDVGGFMARRDDRSITIRVPVGRFDESLKRISKFGDVLHRDVTAEDVTEEFHDLDVRLRNLRAVRDRLEQLLAKAAKVEDSLLIERELDRVAAEIDRIEGRMKFLRDRASYSTITVAFQPRSAESVGKTPFHLPVPWLNELGLSRLLSL